MIEDVEAIIRKVTQLPESEERAFLLQELKKYPDAVANALSDLLEANDPAPIKVALQVLYTVGYPKDDIFLSYLLWLVAYGELSVSMEALHMLMAIGPSIIPQLVHMAEKDKVERNCYNTKIKKYK